MRIRGGDPTVDWLALQPQAECKKVVVIEGEEPRVIGTTSESIALTEVEGLPALRRRQVLTSDELGNRESETIVLRDNFLPYSHSDVTQAWELSVRYRGTAIAGEKRMVSGKIIPIRTEVESPVFDAHAVEMVLRVLPWAHGYVAELPVFHAGRETQMLVVARAVARDTVIASGQSMDAWKIRTDWDGLTQYYWIGAESRELLRQSSELSEGVQLEFVTRSYYLSRKQDILDLYAVHSRAWRPFLTERYGDTFAEEIIHEAREILEGLIPELPYIGGDDNPMTRHIIRCSTSLALYKAMKARGKSAEETGKIIYDAVVESVRHMPATSPPTEEDLAKRRERARISQERRYSGGWVREFVEGDGEDFEYGYDFYECGTQKLYHAQGADEFLPFFCYLDFVTYRTPGWSFSRTMTLAEGHEKCDFRFRAETSAKGGETKKGWPPPFLEEES